MKKEADGGANGVKIENLLRDLLITSLATAGVKVAEIRKIVGCGMTSVTRIVSHMPKEKK